MADSNPSNHLTLIHFGDLHVWGRGFDGDFCLKRVLGQANLILRRGRRFPEAVARAFIAHLAREQADYVLFSGDLSTTSLHEEFELGRRLIEPLTARWGERWIAIAGNHDRYTPRAARQKLFENIVCGGVCREDPFSVDLDSRWTLVGIDQAVPRRVSSRGRLTAEQLARLRDRLARERGRGRRLIVMGHYPLVYPHRVRPSWEHVLPERAAMLEALHAAGVELYLHGHKHNRWRIDQEGLTHLNCGSAGMIGSLPERRPGYLKIELTGDGLAGAQSHWLRAGCNGAAGDGWEWDSIPLPVLRLDL